MADTRGIPYFYLPNSDNFFLDVFIEQGIPGGVAFLVLYVTGIWRAARGVTTTESSGMRLYRWLVLSALVIAFVHGLVDDYLYNGKGTLLSMAPLGLAIIPTPLCKKVERESFVQGRNLGLLTVILVTGFVFLNLRQIQSTWYANLGAVQMARMELVGFPPAQWGGLAIVPALIPAGNSFQYSFMAQPHPGRSQGTRVRRTGT